MVSSRWKSDVSLLCAVLIWGVNMPILKMALNAMPAHVMNVFRFAISVSVLSLLYFFYERQPDHRLYTYVRSQGWKIAGLGILGFVLYQIFFVIGVSHSTAGNAALITTSAPLWTAILSRILGYDHFGGRAWIGFVVALIGTLAVVVAGNHSFDFGSESFFGNVLLVGASVLWGSYTTFNRPLVRHVPPVVLNLLCMIVALPFLWMLSIPGWEQVEWANVTPRIWGALLFSGGLSTGVAFVIWATAVKNVGPSQTAAYSNLTPFIAVASSAVILGERIYPAQVFGGILILTGLLLIRSARLKTATT